MKSKQNNNNNNNNNNCFRFGLWVQLFLSQKTYDVHWVVCKYIPCNKWDFEQEGDVQCRFQQMQKRAKARQRMSYWRKWVLKILLSISVVKMGVSAILMWQGCSSSRLGCKLHILVSLRVFGTDRHHICPCRCRLGLWIKIFTKRKYRDVCFSMVSFKDQFKLEPDPHWSPSEV